MHRFMNSLKTVIFLGLLFGIVLAIGSIWGKQGIIMAFFIGGMMNVVAYFFSDKIALSMMHAQQVDAKTAPDLVTMVERLSQNAGLPMPKVYICPQEAPNAFATGRNPHNAAVAVTQGALRLLSYDELEGVMAHELAHVKNRDTLISCVAATIAGAINAIGYMFMFAGSSGNNREGGHPILALLMIILAPIAAAMIQMAISRSREYMADHDAAYMTGTPAGLISALQKLDAYARRIPLHGEAATYNHIFIVQPLSATGGDRLFSTHPSTANRIKKLQEIGAEMRA